MRSSRQGTARARRLPAAARCLPVLLLALAAACDRRGAPWNPLFEEPSTRSLQEEVERAAEHLREARARLDAEPAAARDALAGAQVHLRHLADYYLPLMEARTRVFNAYRHYHLSEIDRAAEELGSAEAALLEVAERGSDHLAAELRQPLEALTEAHLAVSGRSVDAAEKLKLLASELEGLVLKGELVLHD